MTNPFLDPDFLFDKSSSKQVRKRLISWFFGFDPKTQLHQFQSRTEENWSLKAQSKALNLFRLASQHIPAYKDFLKKNKVKSHLIKSYTDFCQVPITSKPNYIDQYTISQMSWNGNISSSNIISYSSGSRGNPYLWPRGDYQDFEGAFQFETMLTSLFQIDKTPTLFVNCFSMGNYVAGVYVLNSTKLVANKGYPLTIVSPGINYEDIISMLKRTAHLYSQIIIAGYPPFIRDLIDLQHTSSFNFKDFNFKFIFASEFFSEQWRDETLSRAGATNYLTDSLNIYGTADSAIFNYETPTTTLIRKIIRKKPILGKNLFGTNLTPTLVQYNPLLTFYEVVDQELILTSNSGLPLIRYSSKDQGGTLSFDQISQVFEEAKIDLTESLKNNSIDKYHTNLPYLFLTNRTDGAISFYAIKIYPEYVRPALESSIVSKKLSGKFTLVTETDKDAKPTLWVHVELNPEYNPSLDLKNKVESQVRKSIIKKCSEYSFLLQSLGTKAEPRVVLHKKGSSEYFKIGIKQRWTATKQ